jgi:hypothetical protein
MGVVGTPGGLTTSRRSPVGIEFDPFNVGVGLAVIAGGLSLIVPYLDALTAALAALACAGWAARHASEVRSRAERVKSLRGAGVLSVSLGAGAFFLLPGAWAAARGIALGLSLVPLWLVERARSPGSASDPKGRR